MRTEERVTLTAKEVCEAVVAANATPFTTPGRGYGCGRAYVTLGRITKLELRAVAAACKTLGLMYLAKVYGVTGPAIYMGYDNADGKALARAKVFADALRARGIPAYDDAVED